MVYYLVKEGIIKKKKGNQKRARLNPHYVISYSINDLFLLMCRKHIDGLSITLIFHTGYRSQNVL